MSSAVMAFSGGCLMADLLADFAAAVARHPERVAIVDGKGRSTTYAQLAERAEGLARAWSVRGVQTGDRVLLAMALDADLYASLAALWSLGATVVLPEPAMGLKGLRHASHVTKPRFFCSSGAYGLLKVMLPALWPLRGLRPKPLAGSPLNLPPPASRDIALISFTSGTTGAPKAIPRSHSFLTAQHKAIAPLLHSEHSERDLVAFPVFVLINIASGQTSVLPSWKMSRLASLRSEHLHLWIEKQDVTRALLPPSLCEKLAQTKVPPSLHTVFSGGGPLFPDLLNKLYQASPALRIFCVYGSTEAEPIAHLQAANISSQDHTRMKNGGGLLVGPPVEGLEVRIAANEIQVAGAHVNSGYLNPAHDAENKIREGGTIWHRTGDAGYIDASGRLWLLGRAGSQVPLAESEVYPFSVETAARQWRGVTQCALLEDEGEAMLVVEGDAAEQATWQTKAKALGLKDVRHIVTLPMDKRHASKVDRTALKKALGL